MTDAVRARCLDAFYTTKGGSGTGMGLPMVKTICEQYAGRIELSSRPGAGTTFAMVFPILREAGAPAPAGEAPAGSIRPLRILAVDDEPRALDVLAAILASDGHRVDSVDDPFQALRQVGQARYDLVISDLVMPGLSGMQFFNQVRKQAPTVPLILLTGMPEAGRGFEPQVGLSCPVLEKPLRRQALRAVLRDLGFGRDAAPA